MFFGNENLFRRKTPLVQHIGIIDDHKIHYVKFCLHKAFFIVLFKCENDDVYYYFELTHFFVTQRVISQQKIQSYWKSLIQKS